MTKPISSILLGATLLLFCSQGAFTQPENELQAVKEEIENLKKNQIRIQRELQAIKNLLRARRAPRPFQPVVLSIGDDPSKGDKNAKLTLIDFSDYQ